MPGNTNLSLNNVTILIAEDDVLISQLYKKKVELLGGRAITALDGEEALHKLEIEKIDLILLDIKMPRMNGYEVLRRLKNDPKTEDIPVFILTSLESHPEYVKKTANIQVEEYLMKSDILPNEVMEKIIACLNKRKVK